MTRNYIPGIDDEYKFTRPEFAMFLGISPNALRMKMRRGAFGDMYVIKNGKYFFKRPSPTHDLRPSSDHVITTSIIKRTRNRGAHKEGRAKYTSDAFRRHNEMKIINSINGKFKSDEHRKRFNELNDAALKKIDEDIKAEKLKKLKDDPLVQGQSFSSNPYVSTVPVPSKYGAMLNNHGLKAQQNIQFDKIDRIEANRHRTKYVSKFDSEGRSYPTRTPDFGSAGGVRFGNFKGYDNFSRDEGVEVPGVYEGVKYRNSLEEIPSGMSKIEEEIWKLKNKKL